MAPKDSGAESSKKNTRTREAYADGGLVQWQIYRTNYQDNIAARRIAAPNQDGALHLPREEFDALEDAGKMNCPDHLVAMVCSTSSKSSGKAY